MGSVICVGSLKMKIISSLGVLWLELFGLVLRRRWGGTEHLARSLQEFFIFAIVLWAICNIRKQNGDRKEIPKLI